MKTRETGMKKTKAANIKVRAACITGPVHLGRGQLCQDRCRWSTRGANFVAVVSDGAGSTKYGRIGAKIVCDTLVDLLENAPFKNIRAAIVKAIGDGLEISMSEENKRMRQHRMSRAERQQTIERLTKEMKEAARLLQFELAAQLRDEIQRLERGEDPTAADTSERKAAAKTRKGRRKYKN